MNAEPSLTVKEANNMLHSNDHVDKRLPAPAYPCAICYEECSWPADELYWSDRLQNWYCDNCWDEMPEHWINDDEVEPRGISLADELKRRGELRQHNATRPDLCPG